MNKKDLRMCLMRFTDPTIGHLSTNMEWHLRERHNRNNSPGGYFSEEKREERERESVKWKKNHEEERKERKRE